MTKQKTREQLEKEWWLKWYEADYSWNGLLDHKWEGHFDEDGNQLTLQDYWRDQENDLIEAPNGKFYTRAHFPTVEEDGNTPTEKNNWDEAKRAMLNVILGHKLSNFGETRLNIFDEVMGEDYRSQMQGVVLLDLDLQVILQPLNPTSKEDKILLSCRWDQAAFVGNAYFWQTAFFGYANFMKATFCGNVCFRNATFSGNADFRYATFSGDADFMKATFSRDVIFADAAFSGDADFGETKFHSKTIFRATRFEEHTIFKLAKFEGDTSFEDGVFGEREQNWRRAFIGAVFEEQLDWTGVSSIHMSAFSGAILEKGLLLDRESEFDARQTFDKAVNLARTSGEFDDALNALQGGALKLRLAMEQESDIRRAHWFYRFELIARQKQSGTARQERWISWLYGILSDYGASVKTPLLYVLIVAIVVWLMIYLGLILQTGELPTLLRWAPLDKRLGHAFGFSISNVFPLGGFGEARELLLKPAEGEIYSWSNAIYGFIATIQSLFSLILIFLSGLAIRRRFQIS